jgi:hypothetical protein
MQTDTSNSNKDTALFLILGCSFSFVSFIGGLAIGLVVLGWLIWPVQWVDAAPTDLRYEYQQIYVDLVVDSFMADQDLELARYRLHPWEEAEALQLLNEALDEASTAGSIERADAIQLLIESYGNLPPN